MMRTMIDRWGGVLGCVGLMPGEMGRRADRWSWRVGVGVHVAGVMLAVVAICLLRSGYWTTRSSRDFFEMFLALTDVAWQAMHHAYFWKNAVAITVAVESGYVLGAAALCAWGARDESLNASYWAALKRMWLLTPHLALLMTLVGSVWFFASEAWEMTVLFVAVVWWMGALLRCIGATRAEQPVERRPRCEFCGYDLTGFTSDESIAVGHCPECDRAIADSLGPHARVGTVWQTAWRACAGYRLWWRGGTRRPGASANGGGMLGGWRVWWACVWQSAFQSEQFGRTLRLYESRQDHRVFFLMHLLLAMVIDFVGLLFIVYATHQRLTFWLWLDFLEYWQLATMLSWIGLVFLTIGTAGMAGFSVGKPIKRNLLPVAMRASCYMVVWALGMLVAVWLLIGFTLYAERIGWLRTLSQAWGIQAVWLMLASWVAVTVIGLGGYNLAIKRMVRAARFANR